MRPIVLLGSVFDAYSLGEWIFYFTVYRHGSVPTPISEMAGDLWLLLTELGTKTYRSEMAVSRIRSKGDRTMVLEFINTGADLMRRLRRRLKACEIPMMQLVGGGETIPKTGGLEFVDTFFGRDGELTKTEEFMAAVRVWNYKFDERCERVLRKLPSPSRSRDRA
ncbi:hypothetical protein B0T16DRAFT_424121 [Cercophora newfieldiana]|uniref:Uncharacterized protein n=1 Tax=Cercophora newfieldiana TaxID=92897 RepID=A0AA39YN91_9PEZI|nr:hypothetical protein B0T16DRAFT_424121 [Cercophora newfieldiana]